MTLTDSLRDLSGDKKPLKYSGLLQFSGMSPDELAEFKATWASVPRDRKSEIVGKLVELSEDNLELDFSGVFRASLEDPDETVREEATRWLWECDNRAIIRPLIDLLLGDPSSKVRAAAAMALRKFATTAQNGKLLSRDADKIREALMEVIGQPEEEVEVRRRAIETVACFDVPEADRIIRESYKSGESKIIQSSIYAMGQSSNTQWLPTVIEEIDHEDPAIRYEAATACGLLGDESSVSHLIKLVHDDDLQVQLAAVRALGAIGGPVAKRALQQCLELGDEELQEEAQGALSDIAFDADPLAYRFQS